MSILFHKLSKLIPDHGREAQKQDKKSTAKYRIGHFKHDIRVCELLYNILS